MPDVRQKLSLRGKGKGKQGAGRSRAQGFLALLLSWGCSLGGGDGSRDRPLPNVLLVTFDTLRADHCSLYGYERATTPALDAAAAGGIAFEEAYAVMPTTAPSHATLFTSRYPDEHGVLRNGSVLAGELTTMAEILRAQGYATAAFVSSYPVKGQFGLEQGFDLFDDDFEGGQTSTRNRELLNEEPVEGAFDRKAESTNERALAWLTQASDERPFFLWVHYFDPHKPYAPPKALIDLFREPQASGPELQRTLYDAEVRYADDHFGALLAAVERRSGERGTLSIVTADHGEGLSDHGWGTHGVNLYEEAVRVPLVLRWKGNLPEGARVKGSIALIDVLPSVLALLGVDSETLRLRGRDLSAEWLEARELQADAAIYLQRRFYSGSEDADGHEEESRMERTVAGPKWALRRERWKLVHTPQEEPAIELYDLRSDPRELRNVAGDFPEIVQSLLKELELLRAQQEPRDGESALDEEVQSALEQLGYKD